jgi:hypothetical protein
MRPGFGRQHKSRHVVRDVSQPNQRATRIAEIYNQNLLLFIMADLPWLPFRNRLVTLLSSWQICHDDRRVGEWQDL